MCVPNFLPIQSCSFHKKKHKYQPHGAARGKLRGTQMFLQSFTAIHPVVEITLDQNGGPTD